MENSHTTHTRIRFDLRKIIFNKKAESKTDDWLISRWPAYITLNFELEKPGPREAVKELEQMVTDCQTPMYYYYYKQKLFGIPPRILRELELTMLQELLQMYEANLQANTATRQNNFLLIEALEKQMRTKAKCSTSQNKKRNRKEDTSMTQETLFKKLQKQRRRHGWTFHTYRGGGGLFRILKQRRRPLVTKEAHVKTLLLFEAPVTQQYFKQQQSRIQIHEYQLHIYSKQRGIDVASKQYACKKTVDSD